MGGLLEQWALMECAQHLLLLQQHTFLKAVLGIPWACSAFHSLVTCFWFVETLLQAVKYLELLHFGESI